MPRRAAAAPETSQAEKEAPTAFELALVAAEQAAATLLVEVLHQYGDPTPLIGMRTILVALVDAGAPIERLRDLVELGQSRLRRREEKGGHIRTTRQAYYIGIMQRLALQARERAWDVVLMEREDQAEHEAFLRRRAMQRIGHQRRYLEPVAEPPEAASAEAVIESATVTSPDACEEKNTPAIIASALAEPPTASESAHTLSAGRARAEAPVAEAQLSEETRREDRKDRVQAPARRVKELPAHPAEQEEPQERQARPVDYHARQLWQSTLERVQPKVSPATFTTWFGGTSGLLLRGRVLTVQVKTTFTRSHLETRFHDLVCSILCDLVGPEAEVRFVLELEEEDAWNQPSI